jgi:hypothetical protein
MRAKVNQPTELTLSLSQRRSPRPGQASADERVFPSLAAWKSALAELRDAVAVAANAWSRLRETLYGDAGD